MITRKPETHLRNLIMILGSIFMLTTGCSSNEQPVLENEITYKIEGKLLNGTTLEPAIPGATLSLHIARYGTFEYQSAWLSQCVVQDDGRFALTYSTHKLLHYPDADLTVRGQSYRSPPLPKNNNVDTVLYASSQGKVAVSFTPAHPLQNDSLFFLYNTEISGLELNYLIDTITEDVNGYYSTYSLPIAAYHRFWWGRSRDELFAFNPENSTVVHVSGDPVVDTAFIEY